MKEVRKSSFRRGRNRVSLSLRFSLARSRGTYPRESRVINSIPSMVENRTRTAMQHGDALAGAAARMRPVWCAGILRRERRTGPSESRDSEDSRGPGFSPCVDLGDWKRVSVLTRPVSPPCRKVVEVEDAFQIDSRDDRQIQVYSSLAARHARHSWKPNVYTERLRFHRTVDVLRRVQGGYLSEISSGKLLISKINE